MRSTRKQPASQVRAALRKLKSLGLYSGSGTSRSEPVSRRDREIVKKYADVLRGDAKVVTLPHKANVNDYKYRYQTRGKKVVVPVQQGAGYKEKVYQRKGTIYKTIEYGIEGHKQKQHIRIPKSRPAVEEPPKRKNNEFYRVPLKRGSRGYIFRYVYTEEELQEFIEEYDFQHYTDNIEIVRG